jgi:hypothetical protein
MRLLQDIKDVKTPLQEKMPSSSNFTKLFISKLLTSKIVREAMERANDDKAHMKDVNEKIIKPTIEFAEIQRNALELARRRREQIKTKSLLEEIL